MQGTSFVLSRNGNTIELTKFILILLQNNKTQQLDQYIVLDEVFLYI